MLLFSLTLSPVSGLSSVNILPPGGKPYGLTYAEHIKNYWKWTLGIPAKDNPLNDPTGEKCTIGQLNASSPVFYLQLNNGGLSHRTCKVPAGKALFIPVMTVEESDKESPGASDQDLSKSATTDQDSVNSLYLKIGDKEYNYQDLLKYRVHTDAYNLNFANNGIFGIIQGGPTRDVADGFIVMTEPLAKGTYFIHYKSSCCLLTANPVAQDITYTIIAQ